MSTRCARRAVAATCNSGGAGKFPSDPSLVALFEGADVVVVADRDRPGLRHALDVREKLRGVAASVEIRLPALGKDVSDHLHNGLGLDDLVPYEEPRPALGAERGDDLVWHSGAAMPAVPPVEWIAYPFAIVGGQRDALHRPPEGREDDVPDGALRGGHLRRGVPRAPDGADARRVPVRAGGGDVPPAVPPGAARQPRTSTTRSSPRTPAGTGATSCAWACRSASGSGAGC